MTPAEVEQTSRWPVLLHWAPEPVEDHPVTACGLNIDTPKALAWTRSRELEDYQERPSEPPWPPPCPECIRIRDAVRA